MSAGLALDASVFGNGSNGAMGMGIGRTGLGHKHTGSNGSIGSNGSSGNGHGLGNGNGNGNGNGFDLSSLAMSLHKSMGNDDDGEEMPNFDSPKEEAAYYRDKYRIAVDLLNETRAELDEFQISSRELEAELEKELEATEAKQAELRDRIQRLEIDRDDWKTKFVNLQKMHSSTTAAMQREMDNLRSERDKTLVAVRDLEMGNDQLERNERVAVSSLLDMEIKYNRAIEEKTLLEQEVIQRNELEEECQRLKDDLRDANNEIAILRDQLERAVVPTPPSSDAHRSPAPDRTLHSRATSRSDSRSDIVPSPTPTDFSTATEKSSRSTATERTDRSTTITPRNVRVPVQSPRRVPRSTSTPTGLISPTVKRTVSGAAPSPSTSGIPALSRTTTSRNAGSNQALNMSTRRVFGTGTGANTAVRPPSAQGQRKGFKLLHDLQARIKTTDDKIGKMVKKAPAGFSSRPRAPAPAPASATSSTTSLSSSTMRARTASRSRGNSQLAMSSLTSSTATVTPGARDDKSIGFLSPTSWVLLSDPDETPPATVRDHHLRRAETPSSPLDRSTARSASTARARTLPSRPSIPSPLVRETKARHGTSENMKLRHGLSASTMVPPTQSRQRPPLSASISSSRPPSRGHVRASSTVGTRSGATSPSLIPGPRRLSMGVTASVDLASPTTGRMSASTSASGSRPPSRGAAGFGPRTTNPGGAPPPPRSHTPSGSIGALPVGPPPPVPPRRAARRSSMGVPDDGPPSAIPGPKLGGLPAARPSFPAGAAPPVPRIPAQVRDQFGGKSPV